MNSNSERKHLLAPVGIHDIVVILMFGLLLEIGIPGFADAPALGRELVNGSRVIGAFSGDLPFQTASIDFSPGWLGGALLWILFSAGSWPLLYGFLLVCVALAYLLLLYRVVSSAASSAVCASMVIAASLVLVLPDIRAGSALLELFVFVFVLAAVIRWYTAWRADPVQTNSIPRSLLIALPLCMILWVNVGMGFLSGLLLIWLVPLAIFTDRSSGASAQPGLVRQWILLASSCTFVVLLNPAGPDAYRIGVSALQAAPESWLSERPALGQGNFGVGLSLVLLLVGVYASRAVRESLGAYPVLAAAAFALLAFVTPEGHLVYHTVAILPLVVVLHRSIEYGFGGTQAGTASTALPARLELRERHSLRGSAVLSALLLILLVDCTVNKKLILYAGPYGPDRERFPYAAVEVLSDLWSENGKAVVATIPEWSGFVAFAGAGGARSLFDERGSVIGATGRAGFDRILRPGGPWEEYLLELGATHLLLPRMNPLAQWVRESGQAFPLHEDERAVLFDVGSMRQVSEHALE